MNPIRKIINPSLGYNPTNYPNGMNYNVWCETFGKYRWYHENGKSRTIYPLEYNWNEIYKYVCKTCDIALAPYIIYDVNLFTSSFLETVPNAWIEYKTIIEMFSGTLDGTNIDPLMFEAGFTRTTNGTVNNKNQYTGNGVNSNNINSNRTSNTDTKSRSINYMQGVQAYNNIPDIGEAGNDYASSMQDNILNGKTTDVNISNDITNNNINSTDNTDNTYNETIHETRINYYDNLAFLRDRIDRLKIYKPFSNYFKPLFVNIEGIGGDW
jgi:hypothetical protein